MSWQRHLRPALAGLSVYDVAPSDAPTRLHANECPEPWPAEVLAELGARVAKLELNRYPDTSGRSLRAALAKRHEVDAGRIVLGNGSDEIISTLLATLSGAATSGHLVIPTPTFVMYAHSAAVLGVPVREVALDEQFLLREGPMREALAGAALCFLARPNNPTSTLFQAQLIEALVRDFPEVIFVLDEAYAAYLGKARASLSVWHPNGPDNLVLMTTLSKVGLAGLRLGYAIANPALAHAMNKVRHPYNINSVSLALAEAVLTDFAPVQAEMIERAIAKRDRLVAIMGRIEGAQLFEAHGNLVLCRLGGRVQPTQLVADLASEGVRIKDVSKVPALEGCVRASVGTSQELDHLEAALSKLGVLA